jgi:hypothetical protein
VAFDGRALVDREAIGASIPLDGALPCLRAGTNVIGLQVFNVSLTNEDFRIAAGLDGVPTVISFADENVSVSEWAGSATLRVRRVGSLEGDSYVEWRANAGTAVEGDDYGPSHGTIRFGPGETTQSIQIAIVNDVKLEASESFTVQLVGSDPGAVVRSPATATVTLLPSDTGVRLDSGFQAVAETNAVATLVITHDYDLPTAVVVEWFTVDGTARAGFDFVGRTGQVYFAAGEHAATVEVPIIDDPLREAIEAFTVELRPLGAGIHAIAPFKATIQISSDETSAPLPLPLLVWPGSPTPTPPYTNWSTAAHGIQEALDEAWPGDLVLVTNGVYAVGSRAGGDPD